MPEAWHDKTRTQPYPKLSNELYLNPSPLIVPQSLKTGAFLQFALSQDAGFPEASTQLSEQQEWCMFNPHVKLAPGRWFWRYRNVAEDGKEEAWSEPIEFEVKEETPVFVTPAFDDFRQGLPLRHPRLYCFLDPKIDEARRHVTSHEEYQALKNRAENALQADYESLIAPYSASHMETVAANVEYLYQAFHLTQRGNYAQKMEEILNVLLEHPFTDTELFAGNFASTDIAYSFLAPYDMLYDKLGTDVRSRVEEQLWRVATYYFDAYCGMQENHIFDNHFWQQNMRVLFQIAFCLYDKSEYAAQALRMLTYYYELWTARAPASGFNRDGAWINGTRYFEANVRTLFYMPMLLSYVSRADFLQHPWYQQARQSMVYSWPPSSKSAGFGDGSEKREEPGRQRAAFADFLARETGDAYAGWYAGECQKDLVQDVELRLYRMVNPATYATDFPASAPKLKWYKDIGEVVMHSNLASTENNLSLAFRSSTFGSGSHTLADQNSFNLLYGGKEVYYHTGYYLNFSDAHNLMSYRHTRAHNSILVDGIGQPFSTEGYGMLLRAAGGEHIGYCLGDASHAYCGISEDPMWIESFQKAGIEQTPENGFGETPLTKYRRQMIMLYPDIVLIYDELEASRPVRWDWLLHSPVQFSIDKNMFTSHVETGVAVAQMFSDATFEVSQTDQFVVPPGEGYPNQWHLTAAFSNNSACRILTVVQIKNSEEEALPVTRDGCCVTCGDWTIYVNLDPSSAECLQVTNATVPVVYNYGSDNVQTDSGVYLRQFRGSSVLYDEIDGQYQVVEQIDQSPMSSRRG
ncbi:DUF4962 domain-containing protein [Phocaeicola plebeius]|nr:DUF4962 domain-containing protein [Phocaeicola plebeius]